jgi:hypothetical protein
MSNLVLIYVPALAGLCFLMIVLCYISEARIHRLVNKYVQLLKANEAVILYRDGGSRNKYYDRAAEARILVRQLRSLQPEVDKIHVMHFIVPFFICARCDHEVPGVMTYPTESSMIIPLIDKEYARQRRPDIDVANDIMCAMDEYAKTHGVTRSTLFVGDVLHSKEVRPFFQFGRAHSGNKTSKNEDVEMAVCRDVTDKMAGIDKDKSIPASVRAVRAGC